MSSDYRIIANGVTIYLVNSSAAPTAGGAATSAATTPWGLRTEWTPQAAPPALLERGGPPLANGSEAAWLAYETIDETIPLYLLGSTADTLAARLQQLRQQFAALYAAPAVLYVKPNGSSTAVYYEILSGSVQESGWPNTATTPAEGATRILVDLTIRRKPFAGLASLETLVNGASFGNTGTGSPDDTESLGTPKGDLVYEGSPLNVRVDKPTAQSPVSVYLATVYGRTYQSIASAQTTSGTANFTASTAIDLSALRTRAGLRLRVAGRLTTLTAPSNAQVRAAVQTTAGATLWTGAWVQLGSNTTAQYADLGGTTLDALRTPLTGTSNVLVQVSIRSLSGSVTATLSYIEAILYYDWCRVDLPSALSTSQRLWVISAQNLAGGGWLPLLTAQASVTDTSDVPARPAVVFGTAPRAVAGASLYAAWVDANGAHTNTDTTTVTVQHAPLYRTLGATT